MLTVPSGELNMANFNSYVNTDGYWAKALICMNLSGEKDIRVGTQAQYSGETAMPTIPTSEIPMATVNFQRNGSSINPIANTNIADMRPITIGIDAIATNAVNATNATNAAALTGGISTLIRAEQSAKNVAQVELTVAGTLYEIVALPSMTVVAGDRILVHIDFINFLSGGAVRDMRVLLEQSDGTAAIRFGYDNVDTSFYGGIVSTMPNVYRMHSAIAKVITGGTLTLRYRLSCQVASSSVGLGQGQLHALVLKGA
jgi:hypothetical protein